MTTKERIRDADAIVKFLGDRYGQGDAGSFFVLANNERYSSYCNGNLGLVCQSVTQALAITIAENAGSDEEAQKYADDVVDLLQWGVKRERKKMKKAAGKKAAKAAAAEEKLAEQIGGGGE